MQNILIVFENDFNVPLQVREGVDLALAALAYDQPLSLLFRGTGVQLLKKADDTTDIMGEYVGFMRALHAHGVAIFFVGGVSLGIMADTHWLVPVRLLSMEEQQTHWQQAKAVFVF